MSREEQISAILVAIKAAIDRLPQATKEKPLPAKGLNLVVDAGPLARIENVVFLQSNHGDLLHDLEHCLGYKSGWLVDTETRIVLQLFGNVLVSPPDVQWN